MVGGETISNGESKGDSTTGNEDQWAKMAEEAKKVSPFNGHNNKSRKEQSSKDEDEHIVLEPRTWNIEEDNKKLQDRLRQDLALFDKYD